MKRISPLQMSLSLALVAVLSTSAIAQDKEGGRRGGPGGFGGGPGGRPGSFGGGGDPIIGLLMSEPVRKEIEVMPDQEEALTKLRESASSGFDRNVDIRSMSEADRTKFFAEMSEKRKKMEKEMREKLEEVLLPEQLERLEQISIQVRGASALADAELATKLNLSTEQKTKIEESRTKNGERMGERMREIFSSGGGDRDKMREEFGKVRKEADDELLAVLTDEQRKQFDEMKGKPFEMPEGELGRGGFGGGFGGAPGGFGGGRGGDRGGDRGGSEGGDRKRQRPTEE